MPIPSAGRVPRWSMLNDWSFIWKPLWAGGCLSSLRARLGKQEVKAGATTAGHSASVFPFPLSPRPLAPILMPLLHVE
jgi:hypothetical protein